MKKVLLYAAAMVLAGCTAMEDEAGSGNIIDRSPSDKKVSISVTVPKDESTTRGYGMVGDVGTSNVWNGEVLKVFMLEKGTLTPTKLSYGNETQEEQNIFYNTSVVAPLNVDSGDVAQVIDNKHVLTYYPVDGASDFWGCHLDDCKTGEPYEKDSLLKIPFEINGTQDLMVGKTDNSRYTSSIDEKYLYSARSSNTVIKGSDKLIAPVLDFKHLLTRLTFEGKAYSTGSGEGVLSYSEDAPKIEEWQIQKTSPEGRLENLDLKYGEFYFGENKVSLGVYIDSIMIETPYKGDLVVAYSTEAENKSQRIIWNPETKYLALKQRRDPSNPKSAMTDFAMTQVPQNSYKKLGDALIVAPATGMEFGKYRIRVAMHQYKEVYSAAEIAGGKAQAYRRISMTYPSEKNPPYLIDLTNNKGKGGEGYTYNIKLGISGIEVIVLQANLQPWKDGETGYKDIE